MDSTRDRALQVYVDIDPPNDDCEGAIVVPSSFPGTTYLTRVVSMRNADYSTRGPPNQCSFFLGNDVWYQFTPDITSYYDFSIDSYIGDSNIAIFIDGGFPNATCNDAIQQRCQQFNTRILNVPMNATRTYYIYVQPSSTRIDPLELRVFRQIPPSNNQCTNATILDPTKQKIVLTGENDYALHDPTADSLCNTDRFAETFWYKFTNPYPYPISLVTTIGDVRAYGVLQITVFRATNCTSFECIGGERSFGGSAVTYDFVADGFSSYYILLQVGTSIPVMFTATIQISRRFFSLVDSRTDIAFQQLRDVNYELLPTSSIHLNLRASFALSPGTVKSARVTFDNPKRNVCERITPFSVFGDTKGNYRDATIPLGRHNVTATPFTQANCTGVAGASLTQTFNVTGCRTYHQFVYDNRGGSVYFSPDSAVPPFTSLPCQVNIGTFFFCAFPINVIRIELRNSTSNELIHEVTEEAPKSNPVFLFYISPASSNALTGRIAKGSFTITPIIDNVKHQSATFTVVNTTCGI